MNVFILCVRHLLNTFIISSHEVEISRCISLPTNKSVLQSNCEDLSIGGSNYIT